ncbi:acetyl-CoA carboxylase biotin carboxyl carrier protein [Fusobacterium sp. PH5-44]|uniref:acetyl-CoA carboxylase biotin carboxyl carrier protein n=1 Tax=unclassified Fusobacterium TaxID=2648384 RepID=UPI003D2226C0
MKLDIKSISELASNIEKYNLTEVLVESEGVKVTLKKEKPVQKTEIIREQPLTSVIQTNEIIKETEKISEVSNNFETINAPMVGTFYKSPAPGADPFVKEGMEVLEGAPLCILEAMKLMNEVKALKKCTIVRVLVEDGQVVKKGDKLFEIK